jgi:sterol 3beta-glucosyltransferase/vancomycin aglycone glucosyltransferase
MTLGSMMAGSDEKATLALLLDAARAAAVRAIIQAPSWERLGFQNSEHIRWLSSAPHAKVFPHCSAVLHHGGAGTSQAALRAGVPSVVVAYTAEQELWGRELQRLGVACKPMARRSVRAAGLGAGIREVTQSDRMRQSAKSLGARLAEENGVATAVRLIEAFAATQAGNKELGLP